MILKSVCIRGFRSIKCCKLTNCGDFNILIGKNNSGKSNIFSAINTFFTCVGNGLISLEPIIGTEIDFFEKNKDLPIDITLTFALTLAERDALIGDIITEAPAMKHAVEGIDTSLHLSVKISIANTQTAYGFVSNISLIGGGYKPETIILNITEEAAQELYSQYSRTYTENKDAEALRKFLRNIEDLERFGSSAQQERPTFFTRRYLPESMSRETRQVLENMALRTSTTSEFLMAVRDLASRVGKETSQETTDGGVKLLKYKVNTFSGDESTVPNYALNLLKKVAAIQVLYLKEQRKPIGKEEADELLALKVEKGGDEIFKDFQKAVTSLLGVKIDAYRNRGTTNAKLDINDFFVEVNGSGIREALRIVLDVIFKQPNILLVEEPEIHLHPALETSMMQYLKAVSSRCQVFITTHSTNFLDTAKMQNVYLVTKPDSTQVKIVNFEEGEAQIPQELGLRLSSLFLFDHLIFVEGLSDENILRKWATTLNINLSQNIVGFIHMDGSRNYTYYATEKIMSFLKRRQMRLWFLMDRDERDDAEIVRLEQSSDGRIIVKFLTKREIENYLVVQRVITEFIKMELHSQKNVKLELSLTEDDVIATIHQCAGELKQLTIDKRVARLLCRPVHPSRKWFLGEQPVKQKIVDENRRMIAQLEESTNKIEEIYEKVETFVNSRWQSHQLDLVPGDELLKKVCQKYGVHFDKMQDGERIAGLMKQNEIDRELAAIITQIGDN